MKISSFRYLSVIKPCVTSSVGLSFLSSVFNFLNQHDCISTNITLINNKCSNFLIVNGNVKLLLDVVKKNLKKKNNNKKYYLQGFIPLFILNSLTHMKLQWILRAKYINTRNWKVFSLKTIFSYFSNMKDDKHNNKIQYIGYLHSCNTVHTFQFLEAYYDLDSIQYSNSIHWNRTQSTTNGNTSTQWHQSKTHELGICRIKNKENGLPLLLKGHGHDIG